MIFFFQAEDGIRDVAVTGVQTCALPIYPVPRYKFQGARAFTSKPPCGPKRGHGTPQPRFALEVHLDRSEEHTSELQSRLHLVCRLLLEKKKKLVPTMHTHCRASLQPVLS